MKLAMMSELFLCGPHDHTINYLAIYVAIDFEPRSFIDCKLI